MRFVNLMGRATLVDGSGAGRDVEKASDGRFAIGLNYRSHAVESAVPPVPAVITKFPTCVANPNETRRSAD